MKVIDVHRDSPLFGYVRKGDVLRAVNGQPVEDVIDYRFHTADDRLELEISRNDEVHRLLIDNQACGDLGLQFEERQIQVCKNNCIFCFVHQQPKGMRRPLYYKDDDYRFSFTHGNFITLSAMNDADYERIIEQRLSPLYVSVHATDDTLRRCIFRNERLDPVLPRLRQLTENGITVHTQAVLCPNLNDGKNLEKTITDLAALYPGVESMAAVPVGLTRYRDRLPDLRPYTKKEAEATIGLVERYQRHFQRELGTRFVYPADEFFLIAGKTLPPLAYYEEMPQFENGIGMCRKFIADFNRRKRYLPKKLPKKLTLGLVTGKSAEPFMRDDILPPLKQIKNLDARLLVVDNRFWGETVTVSGLLTGQDILADVQKSDADVFIIPPNCLNGDDLFLDDMPFSTLRESAGRPIITGSYSIFESLREACDTREG